ncbi:MAG: type II toxin-antitoxin system VapC family toxin [Leptospiraceae bacterium]|nr:type II toxin-antitoxin system VapC family toxin [Leptospiraceae bacterium]
MEKKILILCDTDIIIEFLKGRQNLKEKFSEIGYENIHISAITLMELYVGAFNKKEIKNIIKALSKLKVVHLSESISVRSLELIEKYTKSHGLGLPDSIIASTAIEHQMALFTSNTKDFKFISTLELYKFKKIDS